MYCVNCGVKLADTEKKCPLCHTEVYHPTVVRKEERPLYPGSRLPKTDTGRKARSGALLILFCIPLMVCFFADFSHDRALDWFGFVAGALLVTYVAFALPLWFRKPNPVIFMPCSFAAVTLYLGYLQLALGGNWFLPFALPVTGGVCLICCSVVTLLHYLQKGKLYILGGGIMALGGLILLLEYLLKITFRIRFIGWSVYPLIVLVLLGGLLIFLAIHRSARETLERKLFF